MKKVLIIVGPTGVGKTNLAFEIAKKYNGELISADSVQVYKCLDIICGKDLPQNYKLNAGYYSSNSGPSIHLLDVVDPTSHFNAHQFQELATNAIESILKRGKLPVVVGGTGLYIKALTDGLDDNVKQDPQLRKELDGLSILELHKLLPNGKLESLNNSEKNNRRRIIRVIEVNKINNRDFESIGQELSIKEIPEYTSLVIGLMCERDVLKKRIDERISERINIGALEEARKLLENYENLAPQVKDANGYKQLFAFLKKETDWDETVAQWKISEYRHAKNQMTWFLKYGNVNWYDITAKKFDKQVDTRLKKFLM